MATKNEDTKFEAGKGEKTSKTDLMEHYNNRFEDAVMDAQYMMIYASTNCPNDIDQDTIKKLINARQRVEKGEKLEVKEEADFWLAYQGLWKLVQPATGKNITAESIKANIPLEKTFFGWLLGSIPFLSRWTETWTISKSRKTVNRHVTFTILVLLLLLIFQIYWVIGNQLITELGTVSQTEGIFDVQLVESQQELVSDALDNSTTQTEPRIDLKALKKRHDRYSVILQLWSKPWSRFFTVKRVNVEHDPKYAPLFAELDLKIAEIDKQLQDDPDGMKAAAVAAQKTSLEDQLKKADDEDKKQQIESQIEEVRRKNSLDLQLLNLQARQETISKQVTEWNEETIAMNGEIEQLISDKKDLEKIINDLTNDSGYFQNVITELETNEQFIQPIVDLNKQIVKSTDDGEKERLKDEKTTLEGKIPEALKTDLQEYRQLLEETVGTEDLITDLKLYEKYLETIKSDVVDINSYRLYIEEQITSFTSEKDTIETLKEEKTKQRDALNEKITSLSIEEGNLQTEIDNLKPEITALENVITNFPIVVDPAIAQKIVFDLINEKGKLIDKKEKLDIEEQRYFDLTDSRPAQLAGQFVLNILQSYILPILYGLLGAGTSVLRSLSRKINDVTYSEEVGIQHLLSISLGALAGIVVGWFSFLIDTGTTTFLGSVSPLAIAFLVGYNIDPFFSRMDTTLKMNEMSQQFAPAPMDKATISKMDAAMKKFEAISQQLASGVKKEE